MPRWSRVVATVVVAAVAAVAAPHAHAIVPAKTVRSADRQLTISIPRGALARPTNVRIRALPPSRWPAELRGAQVRPGTRVYSLLPSGLRFSRPVTITRRVANADLDDGVPGLVLTSRDSRGRWAALASQRVRVSGATAVVSATTRHFSVLVTVDTGAAVELSPDVVTDVVDGRGWTASVDVRSATFVRAVWDVAGVVDFDDDEGLPVPPASELFFCDDVGRGGYGALVAILLDLTDAGALRTFLGRALVPLAVVVEGSATCTPPLSLELLRACVLVTHNALGAFPSFLTFVFAWSTLNLPPDAILEIQISDANNGAPIRAPIGANGSVELLAGISSFGEKRVTRAAINGTDVLAQVNAKIGTPVVGPGEGTIAGSC